MHAVCIANVYRSPALENLMMEQENFHLEEPAYRNLAFETVRSQEIADGIPAGSLKSAKTPVTSLLKLNTKKTSLLPPKPGTWRTQCNLNKVYL